MRVQISTSALISRPFHAWWRVVGEVLVVLAVLAVAVVASIVNVWTPTVASAAPVVLAAAAVAVRRRYPRVAVVAVVLVAVAGLAAGGPAVAYVVAGLITIFTVAVGTDRRTAVVFAVGSALVGGVAGLIFHPFGWNGWASIIQVFVQVGFAAAVGDATRSRRAYIEAVTERARRAEVTKESEARRRVAEERLNIARDLHDVVAHQIAVINLHAAVASQTLRRNPDEVEESLVTIRKAARTVLGDIASLLTVLRASDTTGDAHRSATVPVPGLAGLGPLLAGFAASGLQVEMREIGAAVELPEAVDVVAYRIIQEALTNAHKHGADGTALLQIEHEPDLVEITVTNTVDAAARERGMSSTGLGLVGAGERAAGVQGILRTSYGPGPVHRLTARLPTGAVTAPPHLTDPAAPATTARLDVA